MIDPTYPYKGFLYQRVDGMNFGLFPVVRVSQVDIIEGLVCMTGFNEVVIGSAQWVSIKDFQKYYRKRDEQ